MATVREALSNLSSQTVCIKKLHLYKQLFSSERFDVFHLRVVTNQFLELALALPGMVAFDASISWPDYLCVH